MVNKKPNQSGLKQNSKKAKKKRLTYAQKIAAAKAKKIKDKAEAIEKVRSDVDLFIDTFMINLGIEYPNDVKAAKQLLKWKELKDKTGMDNFLLGEY